MAGINEYKLELLAPAGSFEAAKAAVNAGADAIYMGGPLFSARAYAQSSAINAEKSQLLQAIEYCHLRGVKVYMTLNILMKEKEMAGLFEYMKSYYDAGIDAVIVQDPGVMLYIKKYFPGMNIHISTQAAVTGPRYAALLKKAGAKRVVPARELSLSELKRIKEEADIEVEAFVHGALCYSYSGQCLMSSMIGGRSGNRGRCAGTCRLPFDVFDDKKRKINEKDEQYILSMKDLCGLKKIREMAQAGVCSYKIEGRMKSPLYVAGVTSIYRKYFDALPGLPEKGNSLEEDMKLLREVFDRGGSTDGYLGGHNGRNMISLYEKKTRVPDRDIVSEITEKYLEKDMLIPVKVSFRAVTDEKPELMLSVRPNAKICKDDVVEVRLSGDIPVEKAGSRPVTKDELVSKLSKFGGTDFEPENIEITMDDGIFIPMKAVNELRREAISRLREKMLKTYIENNRFNIRNDADKEQNAEKNRHDTDKNTQTQTQTQTDSGCRHNISLLAAAGTQNDVKLQNDSGCGYTVRASVETDEQLNACLNSENTELIYIESGLFKPAKWEETVKLIHKAGKKAGLRFPHIFRTEAEKFFELHKDKLKKAQFDAFLVRNFETYLWLLENHFMDDKETEIIFDHSIYSFNSFSDEMIRELTGNADIRLSAPLEENVYDMNACGKELIIYGRAPMMVSAQCIKKTVAACEKTGGQQGLLFIKDRTGAVMPVRNMCIFCYNTIYNSIPLAVFDMENEIKKLGPSSVRYEFTMENGREVSAILKKEMPPQGAFTRGHFKKSVE